MNDEQFFLANAYLDGELTAEERRIADADPVVMAEVESLRALQAEMRAVPAPTDAVRESAIAAALAEFTTTNEAPAAVIPFRPRPAYARYLGVAAAVVAVAGLGIIVSQANLGGGDDDASDAAADGASAERTGALVESVAEGTADMATMDAADEAADSMLAADDGGAGGEEPQMAESEVATGDVMDDTASDQPNEDQASEDEATDEDSADGTMPPTSSGEFRTLPPDFDPTRTISDEDQLGLYGVYLLSEQDAGRLPATPNTACPADLGYEILDEFTYVLDGAVVPVFVAVVLSDTEGLVLALDTETCRELAVGSLVET